MDRDDAIALYAHVCHPRRGARTVHQRAVAAVEVDEPVAAVVAGDDLGVLARDSFIEQLQVGCPKLRILLFANSMFKVKKADTDDQV